MRRVGFGFTPHEATKGMHEESRSHEAHEEESDSASCASSRFGMSVEPRENARLGHCEKLAAMLPLVAIALLALTAPLLGQMATADRLQAPGWWPTKRTVPRKDYVGASACAPCHPSRAAQLTTAMARTAQRAQDSPVLRANDRLTFAVAHYSYSIARNGGQSVYTVTDGERTISTPLSWALGAGNVGQTYMFETGGSLHEARASYYASVERLGFTPGRRLEDPRDVEEAMARPVSDAEARRCFGCHTTASSTTSGFDLAGALPGVTCEACHGPGRAHVTGMERGGKDARGTIMNPTMLDAVESVDFCGACHATFWDVKLANERGLAALRSQPHRLQSSRCWDEGDDRITCVACHDPHKPLVRDSSSYDAKCLSCHKAPSLPSNRDVSDLGPKALQGTQLAGPGSSQRASAPPCPTAAANCASCHMPKYEVPEMHFAFTDHLIRVVPGR